MSTQLTALYMLFTNAHTLSLSLSLWTYSATEAAAGPHLARARAEEALINWSGQEVGVAKDNSWVWPKTIHGCGQGQFMGVVKYNTHFLFRILCFLVYCK